jgi:hypothetical protein
VIWPGSRLAAASEVTSTHRFSPRDRMLTFAQETLAVRTRWGERVPGGHGQVGDGNRSFSDRYSS